MAKPSAFLRPWPEPLKPSHGPHAAVLDRWLDADTGLFLVSLGFGEYRHAEIRLLGYSAPESSTPEGQAATAYANAIAPPGSRCLLSPNPLSGVYHPTFTRFVAAIRFENLGDYGSALHAAGHARIGRFVG